MAKHWDVADIRYDQIDRSKIDPDLIPVVKAAALVEYNARDYTTYLCNVFHDDPKFQKAAHEWMEEEVQHGVALGRWAETVDPSWSLEAAFTRFREGFKINLTAQTSVRGSRSGELVARCMVETGTSSYYAALGDATEEPILQEICAHIEADELRHYKMFYVYLKQYLEIEKINKLQRIKVALGRIGEAEDDELAYAYYAANTPADEAYDRKRSVDAYGRRAYALYRTSHVDRATSMVFKACGLKSQNFLFRIVRQLAWRQIAGRVKRMQALAAA